MLNEDNVEVPGIWRALGENLLNLRFAFSLVLFCFSAELVARVAPHVVGLYVHQPFNAFAQHVSLPFAGVTPYEAVWRSNERGARGDLYRGQAHQILVLGSSTSASTQLSNESTWPEQLRHRLQRDAHWETVHIDNLAVDGGTDPQIIEILDDLATQNRRYSAVLIMTHISEEAEPIRPGGAFQYSYRWLPRPEERLHAPALIGRLARAAYGTWFESSGMARRSLPEMTGRLLRRWLPAKAPALSRKEAIALRTSGKIQFLDQPVQIAEERNRHIAEQASKILIAARKLSNRVYWILQPIAYDEQEADGVARRWYDLNRVKGNEAYYGNRTIAESIRQQNAFILQAAREMNIPVIDLDGRMRLGLRERDDLFLDKWHFSSEGSAIAADLIAQAMRDDHRAN